MVMIMKQILDILLLNLSVVDASNCDIFFWRCCFVQW